MKYSVTLIKYKVVDVEAEDEIAAREDPLVKDEESSDHGWMLADSQAEPIP